MKKNTAIKQFESEYSWDNREKVLVFSRSEEFRKKFTTIANKWFASSVYSLQNLDSFITELYFSKYDVIYLDIDPIFYKWDEILTDIKGSKNKRTKIYLVTSNIENSHKLKKFNFPKNIFPLLDGEEIKYLPGGKKYIY